MQDLRDPIATPCREARLAGHAIHVRDFKPTFWDRVSDGAWEPDAIDAIVRNVGAQTHFIDLGAWVGPTTLLAALCGAQCVAVEADPQALLELRSNVAANPLAGKRITIIDKAISASPGVVRFAARRKPGDSMSSALLAAQAGKTGDYWETKAVTPAELADGLPHDSSLFIKLDIEGGEFALLPHLTPLLLRPSASGVQTQALVSFHPGILRETGVTENEIISQTARALNSFNGWARISIGQPDHPASGGDSRPDPAGIASGDQSDCWLFTRPAD